MIRLENKNNNSENESNRLMIDVFKMLLDSEAVMDLAYNTFIIWSGKSHCEVKSSEGLPSACLFNMTYVQCMAELLAVFSLFTCLQR